MELHKSNVAVRRGRGNTTVWVTVAAISVSIGGPDIAENTRFSCSSCAEAVLGNEFGAAVSHNVKQRLPRMLEFTEIFFSLCNSGEIRIKGSDTFGFYIWVPALTDSNPRSGGRLRKSSKTR